MRGIDERRRRLARKVAFFFGIVGKESRDLVQVSRHLRGAHHLNIKIGEYRSPAAPSPAKTKVRHRYPPSPGRSLLSAAGSSVCSRRIFSALFERQSRLEERRELAREDDHVFASHAVKERRRSRSSDARRSRSIRRSAQKGRGSQGSSTALSRFRRLHESHLRLAFFVFWPDI